MSPRAHCSCRASRGAITGAVAAWTALAAVLVAFVLSILAYRGHQADVYDTFRNFRVTDLSLLLRMISLAVSALLVMLSFPLKDSATGNRTVDWGRDGPEYFGLLLLSFAGLILTAQANDLVGLFMGLELASIPTYILVSTSRPLPAAQEAGVKYFFLGALAAAILLMGFAYLYGTTGSTNLDDIAKSIHGLGHGTLSGWQVLAGVLVVVAVGFKMAAVPMHAYAGDVYQGAATPITAVLGFVPKTVGLIIQIKVLLLLSGGSLDAIPPVLGKLLWAVAVLTMTFGNVLGLTQNNVKRMLAYSSVGHSGYLLAGLAALALSEDYVVKTASLSAVIVYIAIYGVTSTASFGILSLIPSRQTIKVEGKTYRLPASSAETFDDLAGVGRSHPLLGIGMAVACFGLIGLPLTAGFVGKYLLIAPAISSADARTNGGWLLALAIFMILNSATGAAFYLRIVYGMFAKPATTMMPSGTVDESAAIDLATPSSSPFVARVACAMSVLAILIVGMVLPAAELLRTSADTAVDAMTSAAPEPQNDSAALPVAGPSVSLVH
ncbi:MAG: NADH-quinone oxidoreductase subunit N [Tepidisphaeraceae bacterium]